MHPAYRLADAATVFSPSLVFYPELIRRNIARVIEMAGSPGAAPPARQDAQDPRDRPHAPRRRRDQAQVRHHRRGRDARRPSGAPDVLIAYPLVGPNLGRLVGTHPQVPQHRSSRRSSTTRTPTRALSAAMVRGGVDGRRGPRPRRRPAPHRHRRSVTRRWHSTNSPRRSRASRRTASSSTTGTTTSPTAPSARPRCASSSQPVLELRKKAEAKGHSRAAAGLRRHAELPGLRGDDRHPRHRVLARHVRAARRGLRPEVRRPRRHHAGRGAGDAGDQPADAGPRHARPRQQVGRGRPAAGEARHAARLPRVQDGRATTRSTSSSRRTGAAKYKPGDVVYALPGHICPTVALHKEVLVAEGGKIVGRWTVASRDRVLTV